MKTVYPTHTCFDDALELMHDLIAVDPSREADFALCHAICLSPSGDRFSHGWVEDTTWNLAMFDGIHEGEKLHFVAPANEYRDGLRIQDETRYTWQEAFAMNRRYETYGPWEQRYRDLCGGRRVFAEVAR